MSVALPTDFKPHFKSSQQAETIGWPLETA